MKTRFASLLLLSLFLLGGCGNGPAAEERSNANTDVNTSVSPRILDRLYPYAWHLHTPLRSFASDRSIDPSAHIHAEAAWKTSRGNGVKVAVIDDYFDAKHPDIRQNVILTYNAKTKGKDVSAPAGAKPHGQLCAGLIGASSNTAGLIGVAPEVKLILIGSAYDTDADTIRAFEFARKNGADVISCSWGSYAVSEAVADEIKQLHDAGITIVFAAGNDNADLDDEGYNDESELPWVIGVSASSEFNDRTSYANYGSAIDLLAPGGEHIGLPTTDATGPQGLSPQEYPSGELLGEDYAFFKGSSASAPLVAGACALLKAVDPSLSPDDIREILIKTADKIGSDPYNTDGFEREHAFGKLDVGKAMQYVTSQF